MYKITVKLIHAKEIFLTRLVIIILYWYLKFIFFEFNKLFKVILGLFVYKIVFWNKHTLIHSQWENTQFTITLAYDKNIRNLHTKAHYKIHIDTQKTQKTKIHTLNGISVSFIREVQLSIIQICVILNVCVEAFLRHLMCLFYNSTNFKITQS